MKTFTSADVLGCALMGASNESRHTLHAIGGMLPNSCDLVLCIFPARIDNGSEICLET